MTIETVNASILVAYLFVKSVNDLEAWRLFFIVLAVLVGIYWFTHQKNQRVVKYIHETKKARKQRSRSRSPQKRRNHRNKRLQRST